MNRPSATQDASDTSQVEHSDIWDALSGIKGEVASLRTELGELSRFLPLFETLAENVAFIAWAVRGALASAKWAAVILTPIVLAATLLKTTGVI